MQMVDEQLLARLDPELKRLLDAEVAAGNAVVETGSGWPQKESVFVMLRDPFRVKHEKLPAGMTYTEPNDPHWWHADYGYHGHVLACRFAS